MCKLLVVISKDLCIYGLSYVEVIWKKKFNFYCYKYIKNIIVYMYDRNN